MTEDLFLPDIPASPMFIGDEKIMTIEWQEFFRSLFSRVGGVSGFSFDELISGLYSVPINYNKRIDELEKKISGLYSVPINYNKRIDELEKKIIALKQTPISILQNISEFIQPSIEGFKIYEKQVIVPPAKSRAAGVGIPPVSAIFGNRIGREYDIGDKEYFELEIPYDIFLGRSIHVEIQWFIDEANDDFGGANEEQVRWKMHYTLTKEDGTEAVDAASTEILSASIAIPETAKFLIDTRIGHITTGLFEMHDNLGLVIERVSPVKDDPTNDPILLGVEIEYYTKIPGIPN
jgi:hypothetical protein